MNNSKRVSTTFFLLTLLFTDSQESSPSRKPDTHSTTPSLLSDAEEEEDEFVDTLVSYIHSFHPQFQCLKRLTSSLNLNGFMGIPMPTLSEDCGGW